MSDEKNQGSAAAGSPDNAGNAGPDGKGQAGQPNDAGKQGEAKQITQDQYEALEKKLGEQGKELGDYRSFVKNISPLLDKLDAQPELIQAILDGKIDAELAKKAMEGKIDIEDAQKVSDAHEKVKKDMGKREYEKADPAEIEKRIESKLKEAEQNFDKKLKESEEMRNFKETVNNFIANTPDFSNYAEEIEKMILENPNIDDIELAYHVVKGKHLQAEKAKQGTANAGEAAKDLAANAAGGYSQGAKMVDDQEMVDKLIGSSSNPNRL